MSSGTKNTIQNDLKTKGFSFLADPVFHLRVFHSQLIENENNYINYRWLLFFKAGHYARDMFIYGLKKKASLPAVMGIIHFCSFVSPHVRSKLVREEKIVSISNTIR